MSTKLATVVADFSTQLSTQIDIGGTSGSLQAAVDDDAVALPTGIYFFTLDGGNGQKEHIVCSLNGVNMTSISTVSRQGVEASGVLRQHRVGATVTITDFAHLLFLNRLLLGTDTLDSAHPLAYDAHPTFSTFSLIDKKYADDLAIAGAPNASTILQGLVQLATQAQTDARTVTGTTGASLVTTLDHVRSTLLSDYSAEVGAIATMTIASPCVVTLASHGLAAGDTVQFTTTGALPTGLAINTTYYVIAAGLTANAFELSATLGGSAINTTGTQSGVHSVFRSNTYIINPTPAITAYKVGQTFSFIAINANTTATPTVNISGLGVLTIKRLGTSPLLPGDITAGSIVQLELDATAAQLQNTPAATFKFGGTGADGILNVTAGTTTIDLGGSQLFVKNYVSINVSVGATLTFSNPHANGTIIILKSQGAVIIAGTVTADGFGSAGGTSGPAGTNGGTGTGGTINYSPSFMNGGSPGQTGAPGTGGAAAVAIAIPNTIAGKQIRVFAGTGGGGGGGGVNGTGTGGPGGAGGRGGAGLYIECGGAWNFTGTITSKGAAGVAGTAAVGGTSSGGGGGGGGGAGSVLVLYTALTANSGTITVTGGTGAAGGGAGTGSGTQGGGGGGGGGATTVGTAGSSNNTGGTGGNGGAGQSLVASNTEFV